MNHMTPYLPKQRITNWGWLLGLALLPVGLYWASAHSEQMNSQNIHQPLPAAQSARIELETSTAHLSLSAGSAGNLLEGQVETFASQRLERTYQQEADQAVFQLFTGNSWSNTLWFFGQHKTANWDLHLTPELPLELWISTGLGESEINLTGLEIVNFNLSTGVGRTILTLPGTGNFRGEVSAGVGETIVRVPAGLALRVRVSEGLGEVRMPDDFQRWGEVYISPNYQSVSHPASLEISGGVGAIRLEVMP